MQARKIPFEWQLVMDQRGISSIRDLASKAGISHVTVTRLVHGDGYKTSDENMGKIAQVLGMSGESIYELARRSKDVGVPWQAPEDARFLTKKQRAAVEHVIRVMVASNRAEEDEESDEDS